jgi:hypothetical protein
VEFGENHRSAADVIVMKGVPEHLRTDNGPEFVAKGLRKWLGCLRGPRRWSKTASLRESLFRRSKDVVGALDQQTSEISVAGLSDPELRIAVAD